MLDILESFNARAMHFVVVWSPINGCSWELICGAFILIYRFVHPIFFTPGLLIAYPFPLIQFLTVPFHFLKCYEAE